MWETSRFRKNNGNGGSGHGDDGKRGRGGRTVMRMKRVQVELVVNNGWGVAATLVPGRLILNDLGPKSVTLFSTQHMELGQLLTLGMEHPRPLQVRGKVTYSALFERSARTYSAPKYPYRIQIEFDFLNDGEAQAVREYVEELTRTDLARVA